MPALTVPAEDAARDRRVSLDSENPAVGSPEPEVPRCPERDFERGTLGRRRLLESPDRFVSASHGWGEGEDQEDRERRCGPPSHLPPVAGGRFRTRCSPRLLRT